MFPALPVRAFVEPEMGAVPRLTRAFATEEESPSVFFGLLRTGPESTS